MKTKNQNNSMLFTILLFGVIGFGFIYLNEKSKEPNDKPEVPQVTESATKTVVFVKNSANEYKITTPQGLGHYSFKHAGGKWSYKNSKGKDKYVDFYTETFKDITEKEKLNSINKTDFILELEAKSGEEIKDKPKPKAKKSTPKKGKSKAKPKHTKKKKEVNYEDVEL